MRRITITASMTMENDMPAAPKSILRLLELHYRAINGKTHNWRLPNFSIVKTAIHEAAKYSSSQ